MNPRRLAAVAFMAVCVLVAPTSALAAGGYTSGDTGHDVSYPNCPPLGTTLPLVGAFGIVGVTHGRAFSPNSCLDTEYAWAHASGNASLYVNLNAPVGSTAQKYISGPRLCSKKDLTVVQLKLCQSYNYGWNTASVAYGYASGTTYTDASRITHNVDVNTTWWLDVETSNSWLNNLAANQQVVQGAIDFLGAGAGASPTPYGLTDMSLAVGVYSTPSMWNTITGGYQPVGYQTVTLLTVPVWYATAVAFDNKYCGSPSFTGGPVWLVQFIDTSTTIDADHAC